MLGPALEPITDFDMHIFVLEPFERALRGIAELFDDLDRIDLFAERAQDRCLETAAVPISSTLSVGCGSSCSVMYATTNGPEIVCESPMGSPCRSRRGGDTFARPVRAAAFREML